MRIRPFEKRDAQRVIDLIVTIQQEEYGLPITAADQPDLSDVDGFYRQGAGNFWVAEDRGEILGTIALLDIGSRMAALRKMFVAKALRGNPPGIAKQLLAGLVQWATAHKFRQIYLGTTPKFLAAHRFYEKNGFSEIGTSDLPASFPVMKVDTKFYRLTVNES